MRSAPRAHRRVHLATVAAALAGSGASGCSDAPPAAPAVSTPDKQFVFEGVRVEERRGSRLRWIGTAERAAGDLIAADAEDIRIEHYPEAARPPFVIRGPKGQLGFDEQRATLETVRIETPDDGVIRGGLTRYDGPAGQVLIEGPLELTLRGLEATATRGVVALEAGSLDVEGPVVGRFTAAARASVGGTAQAVARDTPRP